MKRARTKWGIVCPDGRVVVSHDGRIAWVYDRAEAEAIASGIGEVVDIVAWIGEQRSKKRGKR